MNNLVFHTSLNKNQAIEVRLWHAYTDIRFTTARSYHVYDYDDVQDYLLPALEGVEVNRTFHNDLGGGTKSIHFTKIRNSKKYFAHIDGHEYVIGEAAYQQIYEWAKMVKPQNKTVI